MTTDYFLLCDYHNVSNEGKVSLMGLFSTVKVSSVPALLRRFYACYQVNIEPSDQGTTQTASLKILDPENRELMAITGELEVPADAPLSQLCFAYGIDSLTFNEFGPHEFQLKVGEHVTTRTIIVMRPPDV
ncbi:MAG: hypothetical protein ABL949_13640 [Fimbriimonadaceae bacterium]